MIFACYSPKFEWFYIIYKYAAYGTQNFYIFLNLQVRCNEGFGQIQQEAKRSVKELDVIILFQVLTSNNIKKDSFC